MDKNGNYNRKDLVPCKRCGLIPDIINTRKAELGKTCRPYYESFCDCGSGDAQGESVNLCVAQWISINQKEQLGESTVNKWHYENGKLTLCSYSYLGAETLSVNGKIKVFCRHCGTDITQVVKEDGKVESVGNKFPDSKDCNICPEKNRPIYEEPCFSCHCGCNGSGSIDGGEK